VPEMQEPSGGRGEAADDRQWMNGRERTIIFRPCFIRSVTTG
jgi:hypothetical protein